MDGNLKLAFLVISAALTCGVVVALCGAGAPTVAVFVGLAGTITLAVLKSDRSKNQDR